MGKEHASNLTFEVHEELLLIVLRHGSAEPSAQEWKSYLDAFEPVRDRLEQVRVLVLSEGGRPQAEQRAQLNALTGGRTVRTAVVSSSMAARFVIAMFALVNPGIRGFASTRLADALEYLGLNPNEGAVAELAARRLLRSAAA